MSVMRGIHISQEEAPAYTSRPAVRIVQSNRKAQFGLLLDAYHNGRITHRELCAVGRVICEYE